MKVEQHRVFRAVWYGTNALLLASLLAVGVAGVWEFSTRSYLQGFSDAIVPAESAPEKKVEAILNWMARTPGRSEEANETPLSQRDPTHTLNYEQLLQVCGTATNAFVNLATSSGLRARRLLLYSPDREAKHVVAETWLHDRWAVVDPLYRTLFRDADGEFLTKEQLRNEATLRQATQSIADYPAEYTYESTAYIRLRRIPVVGGMLRFSLDSAFPGWEENFDWLLLERTSFAALMLASMLAMLALAAHLLMRRYRKRHLVPVRDAVAAAGQVLVKAGR
jgi:hypothetical protein